MFALRDIPIFLVGAGIIWGVALAFRPSSLVLHLVTYAVIALAISARFVWDGLSERSTDS